MNISSKAEYGIRAMTEIAGGGNPVKRSLISERQGIPIPFLTQVLGALVNAGLVTSTRGPEGGYTLAKSAEAISLLDIVTNLQGPVMPKGCVNESNPEVCHTGGSACRLRDVWAELKEANERVLSRVSLAELSGGAERVETQAAERPGGER